jgi:hypothetical protein
MNMTNETTMRVLDEAELTEASGGGIIIHDVRGTAAFPPGPTVAGQSMTHPSGPGAIAPDV